MHRPPAQARRDEKARQAAEREAAKGQKEYAKMRRLGIGKAAGVSAMSADDAALYTAGEVNRRNIKARGAEEGGYSRAHTPRLSPLSRCVTSRLPLAVSWGSVAWAFPLRAGLVTGTPEGAVCVGACGCAGEENADG